GPDAAAGLPRLARAQQRRRLHRQRPRRRGGDRNAKDSMSRKLGICILLVALVLCLATLGAWYASRSTTGPVPEGPEGSSGADNEGAAPGGAAPAPPAAPLEPGFPPRVQPSLRRYCFSCHGSKKQEASLALTLDSPATGVANNARHWELVLERLRAEE